MEPPLLCNQDRGCLHPAPVIAVLGSEYRADLAFVSCSGDSESWPVDVFLLRNLALLSRAANETVCSAECEQWYRSECVVFLECFFR